jgi:glycosyltransferase involved in cell wall biosynthesis
MHWRFMADQAPLLAIITSHPIQYQAPLFRGLAADGRIVPHVLFLSQHGLRSRLDADLGIKFAWDVDLLSGYRSEYVPNLLEHRPVGRLSSYLNPSLIGRLRRLRPAAIMFFGLRNPSSLAGYAMAQLMRTPCLYRAESNVLEPASAVSDAVSRLLLRGVAAVVPIGTANDQYYDKLGYPSERRFLGPYAVDSSLFDDLRVDRRDARRTLGIAVDEFVVLMVNKLVPRKDPLTVVDACAQVRTRRPLRLLVVGDGVLRDRLREAGRAHKVNVDLRGFLNQTELGVAYSAADLLVLPSLSEPWGLVVNEAMHFGLPVIVSSKVGSGLDLVREGENGSVFPAGSASGLAARLQELAESDDLAARRGVASRRIVERWNIAATVDGMVRATYAAVHQW